MPEETPQLAPLPESSPPIAPHEIQPGARRPELWSWRDLAMFLLYVFISLLASNLLIVSIYVAVKTLAGEPVDSKAVQNNPVFLLALQLAFYALLLGFLYLLVVAYHRQPFWPSRFSVRPPLGWAFSQALS